MSSVIRVGIADMNYCKGDDSITTLGLGSCVGVVLYDSVLKMCGMVHVMLPDSSKIRNNDNLAKFADTGVVALYEGMVKRGADRFRMKAKIAGGAQMFSFNTNLEMMRVGESNVHAVKEALMKLRIPIAAEDTGLNYGRTIIFSPSDCILRIRVVGKSEKEI
ncbi:MAG: chemotaxis protein CheD [Lachnospiraceae bacterium]|nr:chemotaxis protein CheD [Lachnospiraceae bacterium]